MCIVLVPSPCVCVCVCACKCMYVRVCGCGCVSMCVCGLLAIAGVYTCVVGCAHMEARDQHLVFSSVVLNLNFGNRICHQTKSPLILCRLTGQWASGIFHFCLPSSVVTGTHSHTWLFTQVLRIRAQAHTAHAEAPSLVRSISVGDSKPPVTPALGNTLYMYCSDICDSPLRSPFPPLYTFLGLINSELWFILVHPEIHSCAKTKDSSLPTLRYFKD